MRPNIMIIDDAPAEIQLMRECLNMVDPSILLVSANSGDEAIQQLRTGQNGLPKVILLDLRMVRKSGLEVLSELKCDPSLKKIPVCMFSNGARERDVVDAYEKGASFYFKKPDGIEDLKKFLEHFIGIWFRFASLPAR